MVGVCWEEEEAGQLVQGPGGKEGTEGSAGEPETKRDLGLLFSSLQKSVSPGPESQPKV